jgi:hypothetical protein
MKLIDMTGQRIGRLLVLRRGKNRGTSAAWICLCNCGKIATVKGVCLRSPTDPVQSCGCLRVDSITKHGKRKTPEWESWKHAKQRCYNQKQKHFKDYGGRGIRMCEEWKNDFEAFLRYIGPCPPGMTLDRYPNNDGHYEPGNVRWATNSQQQMNKRPRSSIRKFTFNGETLSVRQWAKRFGINRSTINARLRNGWSVAKVLAHYNQRSSQTTLMSTPVV